MKESTPLRSLELPRGEAHESSCRPGAVVWLTGLPCSGKSTIAEGLSLHLYRRHRRFELFDGDLLRQHFSQGLGFTRADRDANVRRVGFVAEVLARHSVTVIVALVSPYRAAREALRQRIPSFFEVYVACPISVCEARDVKGMYKKARAGQITSFTGVDDPYECPLQPNLTLHTDSEPIARCVARLADALEQSW